MSISEEPDERCMIIERDFEGSRVVGHSRVLKSIEFLNTMLTLHDNKVA